MKAKGITLLVLLVLFLIFIFQNMEGIPIRFLFWSPEPAGIIVFLITFIAGVIVGLIVTVRAKARVEERPKEEKLKGEEPPFTP
jgi:uncharacterized integral membrane protein